MVHTHATEGLSLRREMALWCAAALCVRIAFLLATPQAIDSADAIRYLETAQAIAHGNPGAIYPRIPLLYPAFAAAVSFITHDIETASIAVSLAAGSLLVAPIFALSARLHGIGAAHIAALTAVLWPWLVDYACRAAPEALYTFFWFAAVACVIPAVRNGGAAMFALPVLLLGVYLSRPEGIVIVVAILAGGVLAGSASRQRILRLAPSVVVLLIAVPLHLWSVRHLSELAGVAPRISAASIEYSFIARGGDALRAAARLLAITLPVMLGPMLGVFALAGLVARRATARDGRAELALGIAATAQFAAAGLSTFAEPRYIMATVIALALWSARGADALAQFAAAKRQGLCHAPAALIAAMMLAGMWPNVVPPLLGEKSYKPLEYKIAGQWMRDHLEPGLVFSRKPQVGYYANMPTSGPAPTDTLDAIHRRVIEADMRYAVVDERYSTQLVPALLPLLDPANAPPWLRLLKADLSPYRDARIVIYEVVKDTAAP